MDERLLNSLGNEVVNNLHFSGEYAVAQQNATKYLLVEGATDAAFINAKCKTVYDMIQARLQFMTTAQKQNISYKKIIISVLTRLSSDPTFFGFPKGSEKWPLYGMVDNDYETNPAGLMRVVRLFFTGTHDIETLMLSSDSGLLSRIKECPVNEADIKKALFISYQLAYFRQGLYGYGDSDFKITSIEEADGTVEFSSFTDGDYVNLEKLLQVINGHQTTPISDARLKRICANVRKDMKRKLDADGRWKKSFETFSIDAHDDFWQITNGHDILSAVRYVVPAVAISFPNIGGYSQNRAYEFALSTEYDYHCFADTELYNKLFSNGLIVACV